MSGAHARQRMNAILAESDVDAVVAISPENVLYLSRALILTQRYIPDRLAIVVWPRHGEPTFIVCTIEETLARQDSPIADLRSYVEFHESPVALLADVLAEKGLTRGRIGFEPTVWNIGNYQQLTAATPQATWVAAEHLFDRARMLKGGWELAHLSHAAYSTDAAIWAAFNAGQLGWSEKAIGDQIQHGMLAAGADLTPFLVLAAGDNSRRIHHFPNNDPMPAGAVVHFDGGGFWQGYYSDLARTAVVGKGTVEQRDIYARLWEVQQETIDQVRAGTRACDLYQAGAAAFARHGLPFGMTLIGHSIGVVLHEHPIINAKTEELLQPGMLIAIEPATRTAEGLNYHIEDLILVTDGAPQIVSRAGTWQTLPEIG